MMLPQGKASQTLSSRKRQPLLRIPRSRSRVPATPEDENMLNKRPVLMLVLWLAIIATVGCERLLRPDVSGVWKGSIESTDKRGHKWQGPAELTLNQNGDVITGTLVFTPPQAGRVQVPITSGVVSKGSLTFSGQNKFPMASVEITFHGSVSGTTLSGTSDMTSHSMIPRSGNRDGFVESPKAMIRI